MSASRRGRRVAGATPPPLAQEETHATLEALIRESQSRIDALIAARADAKKRVEDARYMGATAAQPAADAAKAAAAGMKDVDTHAAKQQARHLTIITVIINNTATRPKENRNDTRSAILR